MADATYDYPHADPRDWRRHKHALHDHLEDLRKHFADDPRQRGRHGGRGGRGFGRRGGPAGFPWGGPGFAGFGGGGPRAGRGDIRAAILALLNEQPMHGYQIIQELEQRSNGAWRASPGSVYPTLQQLEDEGLIKAQEDSGRRVFALTDAGREPAKTAAENPPWKEVADSLDDDTHTRRELFLQVAAATFQGTRHGTAVQVKAAQDILREVRRRLYSILAEDEQPKG
jgi:DNA-binding PadR family transcriptional regulator